MAEKTCETCGWWQPYAGTLGECTLPTLTGGVCFDTTASEGCGDHAPKPTKDTDNG